MKRTLVALALAVFFVLSLAAPAFAQVPYIDHNVSYKFYDAVIDLEKSVGWETETGARMKQEVQGSAEMFEKDMSLNMVRYKTTVSKDDAKWIAGAAALTVTSVIELAAPGMHEVTTTGNVYVFDLIPGVDFGWQTWAIDDGVLPVDELYFLGSDPIFIDILTGNMYDSQLALYLAETATPLVVWLNLPVAVQELLWLTFFAANPYVLWEPEEVTEQIWAVQVVSDPGFSGALTQTWEAAYGPFSFLVLAEDADHPDFWIDSWAFQADSEAARGAGVSVGDDYVGNYFAMQQFARTSKGTMRRYIDISSPWSRGYLSEEMTVTGKGEVTEAFILGNLPKGADQTQLWYDLF